MSHEQVTLTRGILTVPAGSGEQAAPGNAATITIIDTTLGPAGGEVTRASRFARMVLSIYTSHISAVNGLKIYFSQDGTNWRLYDQQTVAATTESVYDIPVMSRHIKITYENSANALTAWEMCLLGVGCRAMAV